MENPITDPISIMGVTHTVGQYYLKNVQVSGFVSLEDPYEKGKKSMIEKVFSPIGCAINDKLQ